jgi:hypothetical protein
MNFLPTDYTAPKSSNYYMKLQEGENKIRILSQPILGWEDWHDKKPVRYMLNEKPAKSFDPGKPVKHFWAFIVWNYSEEQIQILHITQATIRNSIEVLCKDQDWGAPYFYDLKIIKSGEGKDTEYKVNPLPHKPVNEYIIKEFKERPCNLEAIFANADPFSPEWEEHTPGIFEKQDMQPGSTFISKAEKEMLEKMLSECEPTYKSQFLKTLLQSFKVDSLDKIPTDLFTRIADTVKRKRDEFKKMNAQLDAAFGG